MFLWRTVLALTLLVISGCGHDDDPLQKLDHSLLALSHTMQLGETREVPLPPIKPGEWVVAVSGQYAGQVCQPSPLSKRATQQVSLDFGASESYPAFLLLVSGDNVQSNIPLSIATSPGAIQPLEKDKALCALIAGPEHHWLVVECMAPLSSGKVGGRSCEVVLRAVK